MKSITFATIRPWLWPAAALGVLALHFWFPESPTGSARDTYSPTALGHKAFYHLVARQPSNIITYRNRRPFQSFLEQLPSGDVLCILGPERPPTADEWSALVDWVRQGGSLLYAFRGEKEQEVPLLKLKYFPEPAMDEPLEPQTSLVSSPKLAWWTEGRLEGPDVSSLVKFHDTLQAVRIRYGGGRAVFVADAMPFSNQLLTFGDNSVLALRLLEAAGDPAVVVFDESLNASGTSQIVGILFDPLLRPVTIQILLITVLFGWWSSRRFGPLTPEAAVPRQNFVEHTDMVGNLYWKSKSGQPVLKAYLKQLSSLLKLKNFRGQEERALAPIARRSGRSVASLLQELQEAFRAVRDKHLDRRQAARIIRRLAIIRRDASSKGKEVRG